MKTRCPWAKAEIMIPYHDSEWGVPLHDDRRLFEAIVLDGAQAGLSWEIILKKREGYRQAFDGFEIEKVARYTTAKIEKLLINPGIVRNRLKVASAVTNAKVALNVIEEFGTLDAYMWQFVEGKPLQPSRREAKDIPTRSKESDAMSKDMAGRGFKFIGTTICYALMQATGMINDHIATCPRYRALGGR